MLSHYYVFCLNSSDQIKVSNVKAAEELYLRSILIIILLFVSEPSCYLCPNRMIQNQQKRKK